MIIQPKQIEEAVIEITCNGKSGTAFAVSQTDDSIILLTAYHTIDTNQQEPVFCNLVGAASKSKPKAKLIDFDATSDVAILSAKKVELKLNPIMLSVRKLSYDAKWETFGFPTGKIEHGGRYTGEVLATVSNQKWDADLSCDQYDPSINFDGLSGAPLVMDGYVCGLITWQLSHTLGAVNNTSIRQLLEKNDIPHHTPNAEDIPISIAKEVADTYENTAALKAIDLALQRDTPRDYIVVTGSPGAGKTTIAAQWVPEIPNYLVCDRYFVKVPEEEEIPTYLRAMPESFLNWMEEVYCRILYNNPPQKSNKPLAQRIIDIHNGLRELGNFYLQNGETGVIVIDGVDDIDQQNLSAFFSILPPKIPSGLCVVVMAGSLGALPSQLANKIAKDAEVKVGPLSNEESKNLLKDWLRSKTITEEQINQLAEKAEGHPLYLRYLSRYINEMESDSPIQNFIDEIPVISGHIEAYYKNIWSHLETNGNGMHLSAFLARMRIPVSREDLYRMQDKNQKAGFEGGLKSIQHLLKGKENLSVYHSSFSDFITERTQLQGKEVHSAISAFCLSNRDSLFSVSELIFQLLNGEDQDKLKALDECNQEWIDQCAIKSVIPDVVAEDIKSALKLAAIMGNAPKVISLLLLWQRVNFRYNHLFSDNAYFLVRTLIAMRKPEEALRYVIRNKSLIVSDQQAIILLQLFTACSYDEQALRLLEAIEEKCSFYLNELDQDNFNAFIFLKFRSLTLSQVFHPEKALDEFDFILKKILDIAERSGNNPATVKNLRYEILSYQGAHGIYYLKRKANGFLDDVESKFPIEPHFSNQLASMIIKASIMMDNDPFTKQSTLLKDWTTETANCVSKHGYDQKNDQDLIRTLIDHSTSVELLDEMIPKRSKQHVPFLFRQGNGVDLDVDSLRDFIFEHEALGYIDKTDQLPEVDTFREYTWEDNLRERLQFICFLYGKARRYTVEEEVEKLAFLLEALKEFILVLSTTLSQRARWERAYALPEDIYSIIYPLTIRVILLFFKDKESDLFADLFPLDNPQLGLYSEGYVDVLLISAESMRKYHAQPISIFNIISRAHQHIFAHIENRWERNEYLLRVTEVYAYLENQEKADSTFSEMIATSMGPSWYKEAQLGIINTAMTNIRPGGGSAGGNASFAAHLQHASGEMTFQRYVKHHQEEFIGNLANLGRLEHAVKYFKDLLVPDLKTILANAEDGTVDVLSKGKGYSLGARSIEEQSGVEQMLKNLDVSESLAAWCLIELWIPGDYRYLDTFVSLQIRILNRAMNENPETFEVLADRWKRFVISEVDPDVLEDFLNYTADYAHDELKLKLNKILKEVSLPEMKKSGAKKYPENLSPDPETAYLVTARAQAEQQLVMDNKKMARSIVVKSLEQAQKEGRFVFSTFSSRDLNQLRQVLKKTYSDSAELLGDLADLLYRENSSEPWLIADEMIKILSAITDENEKKLILEEVDRHIDYMVCTPKHLRLAFSYQDLPLTIECDQEDVLSRFLLWFLDHPLLVVKNKAIELVCWLGIQNPKQMFPLLYEQMASGNYDISREISASIFHQIASLNPALFWENFQPHYQDFVELVKTEKHFSILSSILDAIGIVQDNGINLSKQVQELESLFTCKRKADKDVDLDEYHLRTVEKLLKSLKVAGFLNGKFCKALLEKVNHLLPMSLADTMRGSVYLERSFNDYHDLTVITPYHALVRYALNVTLLDQVPFDEREKASEILRFYQPTFAENKIGKRHPESVRMDDTIQKLFEGGKVEKIDIKDEYFIHYHQQIKDTEKPKDNVREFEILSFLIPIEDFDENALDLWQPSFLKTGFPKPYVAEEGENCIPMVITSEFSVETGSELMPAVINGQLTGILEKDYLCEVKNYHWRIGRLWSRSSYRDAIITGTATTITMSKLLRLKDRFKLIAQITFNDETLILDVFENKILDEC